MSTTIHVGRRKTEDFLNSFLKSWSDGNTENIEAFLTSDVYFKSSIHGEINNSSDLAKRLSEDSKGQLFTLGTSNHYIGANYSEDKMVLIFSFYLYGAVLGPKGNRATFGASTILDIQIDDQGNMKISKFLLSVNWIEGDASLFPNWKLPRKDRYWQPGDQTPVIISELDAPWNKYSGLESVGTEEQQIVEAYSRYSWAIDQNDMALLTTTFARNAEGNLTPMGDLKGLHQIVGQIKDFRQPWPWMQHFAKPVKVEILPEGNRAHLIMGRIIPQNFTDATTSNTYAAFYPLTMLKEDGVWKMEKFHYIPYNFTQLSDLKRFSDRFAELR